MFTYFNCSTMFPCPTIPPVSSTPDCGAQANAVTAPPLCPVSSPPFCPVTSPPVCINTTPPVCPATIGCPANNQGFAQAQTAHITMWAGVCTSAPVYCG
ncbi:MAG: hypothetical protein ACRBFS_21860 [Aureispira sp.]